MVGRTEFRYLEKEILPEIKPCAIQNTEQYRENGFFAPKGMVRYRLVGLSEDGNIIPVETSIPKNLIVTDPKKVREAISYRKGSDIFYRRTG